MNAQLKNYQRPVLRPMQADDVTAVLSVEQKIYQFPWTHG